MALIVLILTASLLALTLHASERLHTVVYEYGNQRAEIIFQQSTRNRLRGYVLLNRILRPLDFLRKISPEAANTCWLIAGICFCLALLIITGPNL